MHLSLVKVNLPRGGGGGEGVEVVHCYISTALLAGSPPSTPFASLPLIRGTKKESQPLLDLNLSSVRRIVLWWQVSAILLCAGGVAESLVTVINTATVALPPFYHK